MAKYINKKPHVIFLTPEQFANIKTCEDMDPQELTGIENKIIHYKHLGVDFDKALGNALEVSPIIKKGVGITTLYCPACQDSNGLYQPVGFIYKGQERKSYRQKFCERCGQKIKQVEVEVYE